MNLRFSPANAKIKALKDVDAIAQYLQHGRKVFSFDLLSGWTCPGANQCLSRVKLVDGKRSVHDGPNTQFRCFSASQEALFTGVFNLRKNNTEAIKAASKSIDDCTELLLKYLPKNLGVGRLHVGGDFMNENYMLSWGNVAIDNPDRLFYAYTKSINYWVANKEWFDSIPNLVLTASYGSRFDALIGLHGLRSSKVIFHPNEANGLEIDHDDSHAADPSKKHEDFALLIHGTQPKDSDASKALKVLRKEEIEYAYS